MPAQDVTISSLGENIFAVEAPCEPDVEVRALLVCGRDQAVLVDTLSRPADLVEVRELIAVQGRPLLVVNSHADWDHWWGNAAFSQAPIIAHRLTQLRQQREGKRALAAQQRKDPSRFTGVTLRPATIAFDGQLALDLGDLHVELSPLPGHTPDCIVAYLPERRLLFAGDAAEDPIPLVGEGPVAGWPELLLEWSRRARTVVPAHGRISGPELLERNAAYLQGLGTQPDRVIPELAGASPFYRRAHRRNLKLAAQALT